MKYGERDMKFIRNHWYDLGVIPFMISIVYLVVNWNDISILQCLALMNFAIIFWHQFEEYRFPGGEAAIINMASQAKLTEICDRYPLNQNNAMIINVVAAYGMYLLPIIFPNVLWLGFPPIVFGMAQFMIHGIITPRQIGNKIYSPGLLAVAFGHIPVGAYWLYYTVSNGMLTWKVILPSVIYLALFIGGFMKGIGYGLLQNPNSKYPFPKEEFERGGYAERIIKSNKN